MKGFLSILFISVFVSWYENVKFRCHLSKNDRKNIDIRTIAMSSVFHKIPNNFSQENNRKLQANLLLAGTMILTKLVKLTELVNLTKLVTVTNSRNELVKMPLPPNHCVWAIPDGINYYLYRHAQLLDIAKFWHPSRIFFQC